jgi:hypothetical protein
MRDGAAAIHLSYCAVTRSLAQALGLVASTIQVVGSESAKGKTAPLGICGIEAFGCRCWVFVVLAPACAALRLGLLLSTLSRLTASTHLERADESSD